MPSNYNNLSTQNKSMSVVSPGQARVFTKSAPVARNWVSMNNQDRAKEINQLRDRQTTKYAELKYTATGAGYAGTNISVNALAGATDPTNLFDNSTGVTANDDSKAYQPVRMSYSLICS